ncbi:hypothetical protein N665_0341s0015 [Sinapis alba]|nr:hypothetical protein N665_0341s0015 [Sinapis alba]
MFILRRPHLARHLRNNRFASAVSAAAVRQVAILSLSLIESAAESHFHISVEKASFLAIASPPSFAAASGAFEFLVKSIVGSTVEILCGLKKEETVELSPCDWVIVLYICSPIRSLIETGFDVDRRSDVRLYYGARNLKRMASQEKFKEWESSSGIKIVSVLSKSDDGWKGETSYVQAAFARAKQVSDPATREWCCADRD